ncbi:PLP-dependent transferase [Fontisphaera persica]|uniref:PLP-dependent transferase n=1 Tax=Fontisphaera persica TaxID=2974023 RepID=UPI0024C08B08|nr:PLP-dependent transferase [Fontisphaera persica]WCJ60398.1 PLP-dependent transferase [Fontisphaera persica]
MKAWELLEQPRWQPEDLGRPLPEDEHAVSMALPRWQDVVGYEEKRPETIHKLRNGYPRFVIHPLVQQAAMQLGNWNACLPFPSARVADLALAFLRRHGHDGMTLQKGGLWGVVTSLDGGLVLKAFWQHTGLIVSSRQAKAFLEGRSEPDETPAIRARLRQHLAAFYEVEEGDVFLQPTGMAAQHAALAAVRLLRPGHPTVQLGFPYVDTLKLQQKVGDGATLLHRLDRVEQELQVLLNRQQLAACFCEIPGNPLLGSADLRRVSPLLRERGVPLVADDVVATPYNVDLSPYADLVATSLTKYIVGTADAMGGAVICNPRSPFYEPLKQILRAHHEDLLWGEEAMIIERQARDFPSRMERHNANGLWIAEKLRAHPAVERVWYPKWEFAEVYESVRRPRGGWGSLVTFLPRHADRTAPAIYDRLAVNKGPSLGTVFTLACPFTLLAHYTELDWAEACGVSRNLIRLSIGLEEPEALWQRIQSALPD